MIIFILAYLGGVLTILSPCILPVLPFVFARSGKPFLRSTLPLLLGMAITFAGVATLAAFGGGWAVAANRYGRYAALILLGLFGITLLVPSLSDRLSRPLVKLGNRLTQSAQSRMDAGSSIAPSFLLGVATGLLWAPCAGPILGLLLTGAALNGATVGTTVLLLAYAAGAATSLAVALLIGGKVFKAMKGSIGTGEWVRRGLGVAVLAAVVVIGCGLDTGLLTKLSLTNTSRLEQSLLDKIGHAPMPVAADASLQLGDLPVEGTMPPLVGATEWLNSPPLTAAALRGKVVVVDFWTYSCINCLRSLPYVEAWATKYKDQGLVVIGVHAPEFAFERDPENVRKAVKDLGITYPVALDNDYKIWRAFKNNYWPAHYYIDAKGNVRYHHFGEGEYDKSEAVIQALLAENGKSVASKDFVHTAASGAELASNKPDVKSNETYIGYARAERFAEAQIHDQAHHYAIPANLTLNQWALDGTWLVRGERADLKSATGRIAYRFHARDLHLVLGPGADGKPVRFRITIDGKPPGDDHGMDCDAAGVGQVTGQRLYQLVRQIHDVQDRDFQIEFLDPGVQAFAFTFG